MGEGCVSLVGTPCTDKRAVGNLMKRLPSPWPQGLLTLVSLGLHGLLLATPLPYLGPLEDDPSLLLPPGEATDPDQVIDVVRLPQAASPSPATALSPTSALPQTSSAATAPSAPPSPAPSPIAPPSDWLEFPLGEVQSAQVDPPEQRIEPEEAPATAAAERPEPENSQPEPPDPEPRDTAADPDSANAEESTAGSANLAADQPANQPDSPPEGFQYNGQVGELVYSAPAFTDWYLQQTWGSLDPPPLPGPGDLPPLQLTYDGPLCLSPPPAPGRLEVIVNGRGRLARPPRLLGTTGYPALDDQAKQDAARQDYAAVANANQPEPRVYWLPVEVVGNGRCE